ncbi:fluoride efflux transporter CrcB [Bacillus sp. FSL K6-3431]|uniref:fluoride efflux transporter CrcB n=1 Tax=Bacillus sp. FSL K6-3431 TaxID=2921500 RepID=UPI0030F50D1F
MINIKYFAVGFGGMIGSVLRFLVGNITFTVIFFPIGTLLVNLLGSFLLGLLTGFTKRTNNISPIITTCIGTGMIGSFTTFSTFSTEVVTLLQADHHYMALGYVMSSIFFGLLLAFCGYYLGVKSDKKEEVRS